MSACRAELFFSLQHGSIVKEGIVPLPRIRSIQRGFNDGRDVTVGYLFAISEEEIEKNGTDVGLDKGRRLVEGQGGDR